MINQIQIIMILSIIILILINISIFYKYKNKRENFALGGGYGCILGICGITSKSDYWSNIYT